MMLLLLLILVYFFIFFFFIFFFFIIYIHSFHFKCMNITVGLPYFRHFGALVKTLSFLCPPGSSTKIVLVIFLLFFFVFVLFSVLFFGVLSPLIFLSK